MEVTRRELLILITIIFSFNSFLPLIAQTDSTTLNFPNDVKLHTVSTTYKTMHYKPLFIVGLPVKIKETSGLLFFNGQLWTHNDSGNPPEIFQVDSMNGSILRTVVIRNSVNKDWEGMAQDDSNMYIGDFGNNSGDRKDLKILKIVKPDLFNLAKDTVEAGYIHFFYPDQTFFAPAFNKNNFDCEAFFFYDDSLHLFSKDWADLQTRHYVVPAEPGWYKARLVEKYPADGLITDASVNQKGNIVLLGYKNTSGRSYICFAWLFSGYNGSEFFSGNRRRIELGSALHLGQSEGIVLKNDNTGWISSESIQLGWFIEPAKLFRFDFGKFYK
jgi:hypothetical protein